MQAAAARRADEENCGLIIRIRNDLPRMRSEWLVREYLIHAADGFFGVAVVIADVDAQAGDGGDDQGGGPASFRESLDHQHAEYAGAAHEPGQRKQEALLPMIQLLAVLPPVQAQAEQ